jgi:hypothetical protein
MTQLSAIDVSWRASWQPLITARAHADRLERRVGTRDVDVLDDLAAGLDAAAGVVDHRLRHAPWVPQKPGVRQMTGWHDSSLSHPA